MKDLKKVPMITLGATASVVGPGTGIGAIEGECRRLGIAPQRLANGRQLLNFEQVEAITDSILKRAGIRA